MIKERIASLRPAIRNRYRLCFGKSEVLQAETARSALKQGGNDLLFFQGSQGETVRDPVNSVGEEGKTDHRNDKQTVPRRAHEEEKGENDRQHGQNDQPTAVGVPPELVGFAQRP